jgi:hypothetical protein
MKGAPQYFELFFAKNGRNTEVPLHIVFAKLDNFLEKDFLRKTKK